MKLEIVFILGPGRSGTSLVTQLLHLAGVGLSRDLVPADQANPAGYWEDRYIVEIHRDLLDALGLDDLISATVPLPGDWMKHPAASVAKGKLKAYIEAAMAWENKAWGIKDPRLSLLIPLWQEICFEVNIPTRYVFCLRHPSSVANSMHNAYGLDAAIGEAVWLNRVAVSLSHMQDEFCLVHYEDLLADPAPLARQLLAYVQGRPEAEISLAPLLGSNNLVKHELNHATRASPPASPLTAQMYRALRGLSGVTRVTEAVRDCVDEYMRFCDEQKGWRKCIETRRAKDLQLRAKLRAVRERRDQLEKVLREQTKEEKALRVNLQTVQRALDETRSSRAFILSKYFTEASHSYLEVLKLPYRCWRFLFGPGEHAQSLREKLEHLRIRLSSGSHSARRIEVTLHSWSLKMTLMDMLLSDGSVVESALRSLSRDFPLVASDVVAEKGILSEKSRKKVLYLGPMAFTEGIWDTRAKYIFPDLFEEIHEQADIFMMTGPVPPFAKESLHALCGRYGIMHFEASTEGGVGIRTDVWFSETLQLANVIRPDVVTNIFGAIALGFTIGMIGRLLSCRSVLRFAGDEIGTRKLLGTYDEKPERLGRDLLDQTLAIALADAIITMSPWEQKRMQDIVTDGTKVRVCIRGVDLNKFSPKRERNAPEYVRFLYVGRKSLEKGYDLIERAANVVREKRPEIEFVFAGNFPVEQHGNRTYVGFVQSEDLPALYDQADALVLTSRTEGFPQVVAEAMAMGKPCILPEEPFGQMFRHEEDVLLTPLDAESIADSVLRLYNDPSLAARLGSASRRIAQTTLDRNLCKGVYRKIILGES
ncbi:MAG: glycosyltransferase [Gammaproteobacteria bacterium]